LCTALEGAALDLYGFAVICHGGAAWTAEPDVLESLLLGLENHWFTEGDNGELSHQEFREELFRTLWEKCKGTRPSARVGTQVPLGHEEMIFFQLPLLTRAVLYLRTKKRMSYPTMAHILSIGEGVVREEVERGREYLLGHRLPRLDGMEEEF
jgi:hypothetical protein